MSDTQNQKVSKYLFDEVEQRLDTIKFDQGADHFLNGEGNYVQVATTGGSQYDDTDIKNSIGTLTDLTTVEQNNLVGAINELDTDKADKTELDAYTKTDDLNNLLDGKADKATDLVGYGITNAYTKAETNANIKVVADKVGDLTTLTTTTQDSVVNSINELVANKAEKTDLDDFVTINEVKNEINQAQLGGTGQVDLSIYQTKDEIGAIADLSTTDKGTIVGAINEIKNLIDNSSETVVVNCMCASTGFSGLTFTSKDKTFTEINDLIVTEKKTVVVELTDTTTTSKYILYYRGANNRLDGGIFTNTNSHDFYGSAKIDGVEKTIILKVNSDDSAVLELSTNRYVQLFVDCASADGTFGLMGNLDKTFEEISKEFHAKNIVEVIAWDNTTMTSCLLSIAYVGENLIKFTGIGDFDGVTKRIVLTIDDQNNQNLEAVDIGGAAIEFDDEPLQDSENAVKSGGVFTELQKKQDKLSGSLGQIVGFDANGNAIAREYEITPDWATFIVEDDTTLNQWRTNAAGGDYERVYIRKNTYRITDLGAVTNGKYFVFNLTTIGTKKIYAEEGAILRFVGAYLNDTVVEIGYEECPSDLEGYSVEGLTILAEIDSSGNNFSPNCFYNMVNLTNCTAKSSCYAKSDSTSINAIGYNQCKNLIRCSSSMSSGKRSEATAHAGALVSLGYKDCDKLLQCSGEAVATSDSANSKPKMFGFETCKDMVQCVGTVNQKYVVIAIAGQSNAVGYDESPIDVNFISRSRNEDRIKQLGFYGEDNLKIIPLGYCAQNMQDMRTKSDGNPIQDANGIRGTKGIQLPLANLMLDYIPDDYDILVLPIAYGGTGFTGNREAGTYNPVTKKPNETGQGEGTAILKWGIGTAYYQTLRDRIIHSLELNESNLFAGIIWCQGENDVGQAQTHYNAFQEMTALLFNELNAHDGGALKLRVPKKVWDADIWYNMETVSYWYSREDCSDIWENYKTWNSKTYIDIPRETESNDVNGTAATASVKAKHFGNNAYTKVCAPRVMQKLIDMNTFTKKVDVVEKEIEISTSPSYQIATESTRLIKNTDIVTERTLDFTINDSGNCTTDMADFSGSFFKDENKATTDNTRQPGLSFGNVYKLDWEVKRGAYWLIIEGDLNGNYLVLGLGQSSTGQLTKVHNNALDTNTFGRITAPVYPNYSFHDGDRIRVYRNADNSISIYKTHEANGIFHHWFNCPVKNAYEEKTFGFVCGIAGNEFNGIFTGDTNVLFHDMKIQKQELFPNNMLADLKLTELTKKLENKQDKITGTQGQIVGIGADGNTTVVDGKLIDTLEYTPSSDDGGNNVLKINLTNGTSQSFNIKNGSKGDTGATGATGSISKTSFTVTSTNASASNYLGIAKYDNTKNMIIFIDGIASNAIIKKYFSSNYVGQNKWHPSQEPSGSGTYVEWWCLPYNDGGYNGKKVTFCYI